MADRIPQIVSGLANIIQLSKWIRDAWRLKNGHDIAEKFKNLSDEAKKIEKHLSRLTQQSGGSQSENDFDPEHLQDMTERTARCSEYLQRHYLDMSERQNRRLAPVVDAARYLLDIKDKVETFRADLKECREQIAFHMTAALYSELMTRLVTSLVKGQILIFDQARKQPQSGECCHYHRRQKSRQYSAMCDIRRF